MDIQKYCSDKTKLTMKESFRVLCVSDIHGGKDYDKAYTVYHLEKLLEQTKPDLVLILGDIAGPGIIHIENVEQLKEMLDGLSEPMEKRGIYWANVFGNHDDNFGLQNEQAQLIYETYPYCISKGLDYYIPIFDENGEKMKFVIYAFDSHRGDDALKVKVGLSQDEPLVLENHGGIDIGERGLDFEQVAWYYTLSKEIEKQNGKKVPAMAVMHVPVQEFAWASLNKEQTDFQGIQDEAVSAQGLNSGFVRACIERGDVKAMCFGHDHENNCTAMFGGILLANDGYLSRHACHRQDTFGGRVFDFENGEWKTEFMEVQQETVLC